MGAGDVGLQSDRIRDGIRLFNEEFFFEAHEVLEEAWHEEHGEPRLFLQGLIQICAGFHHYQNGNFRGAAELLDRGTQKMRRYPDRYMGIDAAGLLGQIDRARVGVERLRNGQSGEAAVELPKISSVDATG